MNDQTIQRPSRARRMAGLVALAILLPAIGVWVWGQQAGDGAPQREPAKQAADNEQVEHEHTNHLVDETSPYLLQHAHNPVSWYPWSEEAFKKAKREDKPIFLSVGYSTCYWCHVMETESFEDEEVAAILNEHFVAIKVDREERPDVDEQYMLATQLMTRRGGWPNSVWLTPEGKPWMAGTYFPKPQFIEALKRLAEIWDQRRKEVDQQADQIAQTIAQISSGGIQTEDQALSMELVDQAATQLAQRYDERYGGFGQAPKFPPHGTLAVLIQRYRDTNEPALLKPVTHTLDAMWLGGMHDHVGGGFHRYATDQHWLLPHFEKMLYDNAQLMRHYVDGYKLAGHERYRHAVADIFRWVEREMTSPDGAFYSAIDSGEVGKEGETYVWHLDEVNEVLGAQDAAVFAEVYNLEKHGNFVEEATGKRPGTNIPHLDQPLEAIARERGEDLEAFAQRLGQMRDKLLARRQTWVQPHKDDKVLTSWNGLMIGSLAYAGRQLDEPRYTEAAARAADFILQRMRREDGTLLRTYRAGQAKQPGYLDDYAYLAQGLVELYRATSDRRWLEEADRLAATLVNDFQDKQNGGFFFTTEGHEDLLVRSKSLGGGGNMPNANGIAAQVLLQLAELTGKPSYADAARRALESMAGIIAQQPFSSEHLLIAAAQYLDNPDLARRTAAEAGSAKSAPPAASSPDVSKRVEPVAIQVYASRLSVEPGGSLELAVALTIDDGWHLYGPNPGVEFLIPTGVSVEAGDAITVGKVKSPEPHRMVDPILKKELNTYTGRIWFRVPVTVKPDASTEPVTLTLKVKTQACDDSRCLSPETTTLRLPLQVDPQASDEIRHPKVFTTAKPSTPPASEQSAASKGNAAAAWRQLTEDVQLKLQTATAPQPILVETLAELDRFARTYPGTPEATQAMVNHGMLARQLGDDATAEQSLRQAAELTGDAALAAQLKLQIQHLAIRPGKFPPQFTAPTLAGNEISLKGLHGKVVLLDFWATWCAPCITELPNLERAYTKHHEDGFEIISISIDENEEALTRFLGRRALPWTHVFNNAVTPIQASPAVQYGVVSIPHTILVGRDGRIAAMNLRGPELEKAVANALIPASQP